MDVRDQMLRLWSITSFYGRTYAVDEYEIIDFYLRQGWTKICTQNQNISKIPRQRREYKTPHSQRIARSLSVPMVCTTGLGCAPSVRLNSISTRLGDQLGHFGTMVSSDWELGSNERAKLIKACCQPVLKSVLLKVGGITKLRKRLWETTGTDSWRRTHFENWYETSLPCSAGVIANSV